MEIDRRELKSQAKAVIRQSVPAFWAVALAYFLLTSGVASLLDFLPLGLGFFGLFSGILYNLYSRVVDFGFDLWTLWTWRQLKPGLNALTQGFQVAGRVILMEVEIFCRILGWALLYYLFFLLCVMFAPISAPVPLLGAAVLAVALQLRYALAPYLLADHPDDGSSAAVRRSVELMRGWKWQLFKLEFSFIGWILLGNVLAWAVEGFLLWQNGFFQLVSSVGPLSGSGLTSAVSGPMRELWAAFNSVDTAPLTILLSNLLTLPVFLWLMPYRGTARAGFYDARLRFQNEQATDLPPL